MEKRHEKGQRSRYPKIIVITGAESTGKSTLTEQLAKSYHVPFIPELGRKYIENLDRKYTYADVENIAKDQVLHLKKYKNTDYPYLFLDTWLIITKIWFEVVYQKEPVWLTPEIQKTKIDLFIVCDTDLPWIPDPVRENGGEMREILQSKYIETISKFNFNYKIVSGKDHTRFKQAQKWLSELQ